MLLPMYPEMRISHHYKETSASNYRRVIHGYCSRFMDAQKPLLCKPYILFLI